MAGVNQHWDPALETKDSETLLISGFLVTPSDISGPVKLPKLRCVSAGTDVEHQNNFCQRTTLKLMSD